MWNLYLTVVGSQSFIESVKASLGFRAKGRDIIESGAGYQLRESPAPYNALFEAENEDIGLENTRFWDVKAVQVWVELRPLLTSGRSVTVTYEIVRSGF